MLIKMRSAKRCPEPAPLFHGLKRRRAGLVLLSATQGFELTEGELRKDGCQSAPRLRRQPLLPHRFLSFRTGK